MAYNLGEPPQPKCCAFGPDNVELLQMDAFRYHPAGMT
jgi:hypothetical protein